MTFSLNVFWVGTGTLRHKQRQWKFRMLVVVTGVTRTMLHLHPDVRSGVGLQTEDTDVLLLSWFWWTWWFCSWPVLLSSTEVAPPTLALPLSLAPPPFSSLASFRCADVALDSGQLIVSCDPVLRLSVCECYGFE